MGWVRDLQNMNNHSALQTQKKEAKKQTKLLEQMAQQHAGTAHNPPVGWYATKDGSEWVYWNGRAWTGDRSPRAA
jgi:hypothetical protein